MQGSEMAVAVPQDVVCVNAITSRCASSGVVSLA